MSEPSHSPDSLSLDLLDALDAIVYVADLETYELLFLNRQAREFFGSRTGEKCWQVLQADQAGPCNFCSNQQLLNKDGSPAEPYVWEFQNTINGEWWECRDRAIEWTDGRLVRLEIATNITESKRLRDQLQESEGRYRALYENSPLPYQSLDKNGCFIDVNPAWLKTLGYDRAEVIGQYYGDFLHPEWQPKFAERFPEFKKRGYVRDVHFKIRHKQDHYLDISFEGCVGYGPDGEFRQTYCVFQDVSARVKTQEKLQESERKFRLLTDYTHDWEYWIDPAGNYIYISPSCEKITGYTQDEFINNPKLLFEITVPEDATRVQHHYVYEAVQNRPAMALEFSIITKNGEKRWLEHYCSPILDDTGQFAGRRGNNRDITNRKKAEEKLVASEKRLSMALKGAKCGLWEWTIPENRVFFDANYYLIAGYKPYQFSQAFAEWEKRVHPDDLAPTKSALQRYLGQEIPAFSVEFRFRRESGEWMWLLAQGEIVEQAEDGSPVRISGLHIDIDDSKKAEFERLELEQQLRQKFKMEAVGAMAGGMAHNFNNSLAIILGSLEMAQRKITDRTRVENYLKTATKAALGSRDLVQQVLSYSRQETQAKQPTQVSQVLEEIHKMLRPTIPTSIDLHYQVSSPDKNLVIEANSGQIQEAVLNLCNNAVHSMAERGTLRLCLDQVVLRQQDIPSQFKCQPGEFARIAVADTGCGIDQKIIDKVFDPFFTTKGVNEGTGIGLSSVRGIVLQHEGLVKVHSSLGQGSTFELYFPVSEALPSIIAEENVQIPGGSERILLVDDEKNLIKLCAQMLGDLGYRVTAETSSRKALELVQSDPAQFDLLITDQTMPDLTGKDLAREIKQLNPDLPIILCTGFSNQVSAEDASQFGINAFCPKPLKLTELARAIRNSFEN